MKHKLYGQTWLLLLSLLFLAPAMRAQSDDDFFSIGGVVKHATSKKSLEYVNVSVVGTNIGTISNENGEFVLKIGNGLTVREIELSCVGYYNARQTVSASNVSNQVFYLSPRSVELDEFEVLGWKNPADLVTAAIDRVTQNYSATPNLLTAFYRETIQKGKRYINVSEAVMDVYKSPYKVGAVGDRVQILKGRKLLSPNQKDTLAVKLVGGPNTAVFVDVVKNPDVLLDKELLRYYVYTMGETTSIDDRLHYVVYFKPQMLVSQPLYAGTYYIDKETLAFTRIEFSMDMRDKDEVTKLIVRNKPSGLRFTPDELSYIVAYKQHNGKSYLNYIRNEMRFRCDWKRKLFFTHYTIISEMVMTNRTDENVTKITGKNAFSSGHSLSEKVMSYYDKDFWGSYNIIEPTESLESAVTKLKRTDTVVF
ncbi:MAG: carboxypeptidase-like regulatory domain-containing protein [Candidatus Symbiothrix sp.]|jgi:hypothetical protein|nr:carboxypeptidase-like regulatory domain-containing protein [Candidatus Symbiothrix sp.]